MDEIYNPDPDQPPLFKVGPGEAGHKPKQPVFDLPKDNSGDEEATEEVKTVDPESGSTKVEDGLEKPSPNLEVIREEREEREKTYRQ